MAIVTVGMDLAKNVFALDRVDATGRAVLQRPGGDRHVQPIARDSALARRLMRIPLASRRCDVTCTRRG